MSEGPLWRAWLQAARPLAHANIAIPLLLGQGLAHAAFGTFSWRRFALIHAYGVLAHLFIVFANDVADHPDDAKNLSPTPFSGGSRVLVEGKLAPKTLALAALGVALTLGAFGAFVAFGEGLALALVLVTLPLLLTWLYSFPPLRLSYRGHGEWLQALGVGVALPATAFYFQVGTFAGLSLQALAVTLALGWAGNLITALPDELADRRAGKRTHPVRRSGRRTRRDVLLVLALCAFATPLVVPGASLPLWIPAAAVPLGAIAAAAPLAPDADATDRPRCLRFVVLTGSAGALLQLAWTVLLFLV